MAMDMHRAVREFLQKYPGEGEQWRKDANNLLSRSALAQDILNARSIPEGLVFLARRVSMDVQADGMPVSEFVLRLRREMALAARSPVETIQRAKRAARTGVP